MSLRRRGGRERDADLRAWLSGKCSSADSRLLTQGEYENHYFSLFLRSCWDLWLVYIVSEKIRRLEPQFLLKGEVCFFFCVKILSPVSLYSNRLFVFQNFKCKIIYFDRSKPKCCHCFLWRIVHAFFIQQLIVTNTLKRNFSADAYSRIFRMTSAHTDSLIVLHTF